MPARGRGGKKGATSAPSAKQKTAKERTSSAPKESNLFGNLFSAGNAAGAANAFTGATTSDTIAQRVAESSAKRESSLASLSDAQLDQLWERFNRKEARDDDEFEIWPDIADRKTRRSNLAAHNDAAVSGIAAPATSSLTLASAAAPATSSPTLASAAAPATSSPTLASAAAPSVAIVRDGDEYDSDDEKTLEDVVYPQTLMPAVEERSMDDIFGVQKSKDGSASLLSNLLDPDAGGKGKNKNGLHGLKQTLLGRKKRADMTARQRLRQRMHAMKRARSGMTADQVVRDHRGKVVRGARQVTEDDVAAGVVKRNQLDPTASRNAIRAKLAAARAEMAAKKAEQQPPPEQQMIEGSSEKTETATEETAPPT